MKDMTKEEWQKEARYLYLLLIEQHEALVKLQIELEKEQITKIFSESAIIESSWVVYCIEKNIKAEDYEL